MNLNFKNALVTGGAGFIGSHLVDALVAENCKVLVMDNLSTGNLSNLANVQDRIAFHQGDIRDQQLLMDLARGCDVIFHLAAEVSVPRSVENPVESAMINELGTLHVLEAARANSVKRVVFSSSCAVYGEGVRAPKKENMAPEPLSPYAVQKLTGEFYAQLYYNLYGVETVCLRYFNVFGPRQDPSSPYSGVISIFMTKAIASEKPFIFGDGEQFRDFVFVKDVVRANLIAGKSERAAGGIFNVGTGSHVKIKSLWDTLCRFLDQKIEPVFKPPRAGDILESVADVERIRGELDFAPKFSFEKGLELTLDWYQKGVAG